MLDVLNKFFNCILICLIIFINVVRFIALEDSPPGFYIDEVAGATHIACLRQTGADAYGKNFQFLAKEPVVACILLLIYILVHLGLIFLVIPFRVFVP